MYLSPPDVTDHERSLLLEAFDSGWVSTVGPHLERFEAAIAHRTGRRFAVALSSGTSALHLALHVLGVGDGDEVLVSSFTFVASANVVRYVGADPVFVDSESSSWGMDPVLLEAVLAERAAVGRVPAAVVVVDLYGQCADLVRIAEICDRHGVPLVEDAAESLGARCHGREAGSFGLMAAVSFNGNKIATTSGGGALVTDDADLARRVRHLATQAREPVLHYEHVEMGFNHRLSNLLAAVGIGQLDRLDDMIARRLAVHSAYADLVSSLPGVDLMPRPAWSDWNGWLSCITLPDADTRDRVIAALATEDIESRPLWKPMHLQPLYRASECRGGGVSADLFTRGMCLPSGSALTGADIDRITTTIRRVL